MLKKALNRILFSQISFDFFQKLGVHITPNDYYSPIPDTGILNARKDLFEEETELVGVNLNIEKQLDFLENVFPPYQAECDFPLNKTSTPHEYFIDNGAFGLVSVAVLHCMIRYFVPQTVIEVGGGNSTYVSARANLMNQNEGKRKQTKLYTIEPHPSETLKKGFPGLSELIPKKVEKIDINFFTELQDNDILFIDSSHVSRIGSDVNFIYLEILPRLKGKVIIHIHDIFFPKLYPEEWVMRKQRFWNEQYLLQAFLINNNQCEVLWCESYMYLKHRKQLKSTFPSPKGLGYNENIFASSFWMRKID